jgi:hypothetical protein
MLFQLCLARQQFICDIDQSIAQEIIGSKIKHFSKQCMINFNSDAIDSCKFLIDLSEMNTFIKMIKMDRAIHFSSAHIEFINK